MDIAYWLLNIFLTVKDILIHKISIWKGVGVIVNVDIDAINGGHVFFLYQW